MDNMQSQSTDTRRKPQISRLNIESQALRQSSMDRVRTSGTPTTMRSPTTGPPIARVQRHSSNPHLSARVTVAESLVQLVRLVYLNDRGDSQLFTFLVPAQLTRGFVMQASSREFFFGGVPFTLLVQRSETRHLSVQLVLATKETNGEQVRVRLDLVLSVVHREHYRKNLSYSAGCVEFCSTTSSYGKKDLAMIAELTANKGYLLDDQRIILELELANLCYTFHQTFTSPPSCGLCNAKKSELNSLSDGRRPGQILLESQYFLFGKSDWNLKLMLPCPDSKHSRQSKSNAHSNEAETNRATVAINRQSLTEQYCRLCGEMALVFSGARDAIALREETLDVGASSSRSLTFGGLSTSDLHTSVKSKWPLTLSCELSRLTAAIPVEVQARSGDAAIVARFYDADKQEWALDCDLLGTYLRFRLYYLDIKDVPRGCSRVVRWNVRLLPWSTASLTAAEKGISSNSENARRSIRSTNGPFVCYYTQKDIDEGTAVQMDVLVQEASVFNVYEFVEYTQRCFYSLFLIPQLLVR